MLLLKCRLLLKCLLLLLLLLLLRRLRRLQRSRTRYAAHSVLRCCGVQTCHAAHRIWCSFHKQRACRGAPPLSVWQAGLVGAQAGMLRTGSDAQ